MPSLYLNEREISVIVKRLAEEIPDSNMVAAVVLHAAFWFASDLLTEMRALGYHLDLIFIKSSSYRGKTTPQGPPQVEVLPGGLSLENRQILLIDTVLDTGNTLRACAKLLHAEYGVDGVNFAVLVDKRRTPLLDTLHYVDQCWIGLRDSESSFLYGYGLDIEGEKRGLRSIWSV